MWYNKKNFYARCNMKSMSCLGVWPGLPGINVVLSFFLPVLIGCVFSPFATVALADQVHPGGNPVAADKGGSLTTSEGREGKGSGYSDKNSKAIPIIPDHVLTVSRSGSGTGTVTGAEMECGTTCLGVFPRGMVVELTAVADVGSSFAGWSGGGCAGTVPCRIAMNASIEVTATFRKVHAVSLITNRGGKITPVEAVPVATASDEAAEVSIVTVDSGASLSVRISPCTGCHVSAVQVDGDPVDATDIYTFRNIAADHTMTVSFAADSCSAADAEQGGAGVSRK